MSCPFSRESRALTFIASNIRYEHTLHGFGELRGPGPTWEEKASAALCRTERRECLQRGLTACGGIQSILVAVPETYPRGLAGESVMPGSVVGLISDSDRCFGDRANRILLTSQVEL